LFRRDAETSTRDARAIRNLKKRGSQIGCRLRFNVVFTLWLHANTQGWLARSFRRRTWLQ